MSAASPPRFGRSPHLVTLVAEVERLATLVAAAPPDARRHLRTRRTDDVVRATLALDGADLDAPVDDTPVDDADLGAPGAAYADDKSGRRGTWLDTMRVQGEPADARIRALEIAGVRAADDADELTGALLTDPVPTLGELHRRLTGGLVADERAGTPRTTDQAVHDGSTGRVLYFTVEVEQVARELGLTGAWLASAGSREHGLVVSGVLHHELLRIHPYDAANGRLARAAARLVLRARGLDPDHLAAPEPTLARDPLGYHEEVARSLRRRDLTIWLERWGDAVADGLRRAARDLGLLDVAVPDATLAFLDANPAFTLVDYRAELRSTPQDTGEQLGRLLDTGRIRRVPGSRGLRFTVTDADR